MEDRPNVENIPNTIRTDLPLRNINATLLRSQTFLKILDQVSTNSVRGVFNTVLQSLVDSTKISGMDVYGCSFNDAQVLLKKQFPNTEVIAEPLQSEAEAFSLNNLIQMSWAGALEQSPKIKLLMYNDRVVGVQAVPATDHTSQSELETLRRLVEELQAELAVSRGQVAALEVRVAALEVQIREPR